MQSDEDVVFDIFNKASRDEDSILYQIYGSKYVWIIMKKILIILTFYENAY